jgi:hypothetical protein
MTRRIVRATRGVLDPAAAERVRAVLPAARRQLAASHEDALERFKAHLLARDCGHPACLRCAPRRAIVGR